MQLGEVFRNGMQSEQLLRNGMQFGEVFRNGMQSEQLLRNGMQFGEMFRFSLQCDSCFILVCNATSCFCLDLSLSLSRILSRILSLGLSYSTRKKALEIVCKSVVCKVCK
jgi:hypothetical protein